MQLEGFELGNYRVGPELGRGGMGTVYRASTITEGPAGPPGSPVALKVFHEHLAAEERAFDRFRREAEIGKSLRHPNLVRTYDIGDAQRDGRAVHFMVMELIEGQTLADLQREFGTVPEQLRYQIADQVLGALEAVHARGVVHRDVKPENIVITPDHRALLMDLGVARLQERGQTLTEAGEFVGSLAYAAPEQFRPDERDIGPRADLYAFGLVLFELSTGRRPFDVADLPALLRAKLQVGVPAPRSVHPEVDAFWNEVIVTATRNEASDRFADAAEMRRVLQEGEASAWWRGRLAKVTRPAAERSLKRLRLDREAPLIGRADAVAVLDRAWDRARQGGGVLLLGGVSGVGKSRLLYEFLERVASADGPAIAAGRGVGAGGRSYQPFVEALLDLLLPADVEPTARRAPLEARLGPLLADTPGVVPYLAEFLLGGIQPGVDGAFSKDAVLAATAQVLFRLAKERPLILVVEDLHLAGPESLELFRYLARGVRDLPLLLVGVCSDDEIEDGTPLHAFLTERAPGPVERLTLRPLDDAATEELVRAVVRTEKTVRALARPVHDRGDANPFLVLELLAQLRADGALVAQGDGFELVRPVDELTVPTTIRDLVGMKLTRLDDEQRETLEAAAVLGYEFEAPLLAAVLEQNRIHLLKRLAGLERRHRLLVGAGKSAFRFARRQVYETVYDGMNPGLRAEYHALVADTILARVEGEGALTPETAYALVRHLYHGGRAAEAEPYVESALDHMAARLHASDAAPFLEKLSAALVGAAPARRFAIAMRQWTFYELLGSRADQLRVLETAHELAERLGEPGPRARVHAYRAGSYWYAGDYERAAGEARAGLALARAAGDRKWEATCNHTLGAVAFRRGELDAAAAALREALKVRREIGDRRGEASTLQALGLVMADVGQEAEVLPTLEEALKIWHEVGERRGEAAVRMNIGNHLVDTARYEEGLRYHEQAIAGHRETGALLSEALALANLGHAQELLGRIDAARTTWQRALGIFVDLGDPNGEIAVRTMLGAALGGYGDHAEAKQHLTAAIELATRKGAQAKLAAAHRAMGGLLHGLNERADGWEHLRRALALESELKGVTSRVLTLCEMGSAALAEGDSAGAARWLTEALPDARRGAPGTAALVLCRLARAHRDAGRADETRACVEEALERVEAMATVSPVQGPEIYATLADLVDGRREEFLTRARNITEARARHIRSESRREHFLTQSRLLTTSVTSSGGGHS